MSNADADDKLSYSSGYLGVKRYTLKYSNTVLVPYKLRDNQYYNDNLSSISIS